MNSIGSQLCLPPPVMPPCLWLLPPHAPDVDVFIPISFPPAPPGAARIFLPPPARVIFLGDLPVRSPAVILPSADTGHPFAGDRQDPHAKVYVAGGNAEPLLEDRLAMRFSEFLLKCGFLSDEDFDAVLVSTMLKMGGGFTLRTFTQALFVEGGWHWIRAFRAGGRVSEWERKGILSKKEDGERFVLKNTGQARRFVRDYVRANERRAQILGLAETPKQKDAPDEIRPALAELIARQEAILKRAQALNDHADRRIRDLARRLEKRLGERMALMPRRLDDLGRQLIEIEESARQSGRAPTEIKGPLGRVKTPASIERDKDPFVTAGDMETYFDAIDAVLRRIFQTGGNGNGDLATIEDRYLGWLSGTPARQSELREVIKSLRKIESELLNPPRAQGDREPAISTPENQPTAVQIDWSEFPRVLKPREALGILMRNGFVRTHGGYASSGHRHFTHLLLSGKYTIPFSTDGFREKKIAAYVKTALNALAKKGIEVKW